MENLELGKKYIIHSYKHNSKIHRAWDEAVLLEIHDDYLMVSCTNSPKMIKVIYSKNNLSNFKEKQKIAIFFASTNTSTLSDVRIKILE